MKDRHEVSGLGDEWHTARYMLASSIGGGTDKELIVSTRFDGNGNAVVRFLVRDHDKEVLYEKFDAAVYNYNRAR
jgi:hypothetical protein